MPSVMKGIPLLFVGLAPFAGLLALGDDPGASFARLWPVTPVAVLASAFANATAIGGGFLFVPVFILGYGLDPLVALPLSLSTQAVGMSSGALGWSRRFVAIRPLTLALAGALPGMVLGTFVWTPSAIQVKGTFGWVSLLVGLAMFLEYRADRRDEREAATRESAVEGVVYWGACLAGGLVTAWVSIGIGEVVALWLLLLHRRRIEVAIGTGVVALAACSVLGFFLHAGLSYAGSSGAAFPWTYLAFTVPGVLVGGYAGARIGRRLEERARAGGRRSPLKAIFAVVVLCDGIVMLWHAAG